MSVYLKFGLRTLDIRIFFKINDSIGLMLEYKGNPLGLKGLLYTSSNAKARFDLAKILLNQ